MVDDVKHLANKGINCSCHNTGQQPFTLSSQGAAADSESKSEELSGAVEELHKLLKDAVEGEGERETRKTVTHNYCLNAKLSNTGSMFSCH